MGGRLLVEVRSYGIFHYLKLKQSRDPFNIWNNLPSEIKLSQCLNSFKRNLRKYLLKDK